MAKPKKNPISEQLIEAIESSELSDPETVPGTVDLFVRRWSMHILPKGFTKTRSCAGT